MLVELAVMFFAGNLLARAGVDLFAALDGTARQRESDLQQERAGLERARAQLARERDEIVRDLREVNGRLAEEMRRLGIGGRGRPGRKDAVLGLESERERLKEELWQARYSGTRSQFLSPGSRPTEAAINPQNMHVAQYHIGQLVTGKKCRRCGRDMVLQFPREEELRRRNVARGLPGLHLEPGDLYWGCTGFYYGTCRQTGTYTHRDGKLFAPQPVEEFEVTQTDLHTIYETPAVQRGASKRLREHRNHGTKDYLCPVHGEPLVLREKKQFAGALDQFFLGCPQWRENDPACCNYIVKIKSPAQLAAVLRDYEGKGIL